MRKHYIYIFLILISFFSIISNVKAKILPHSEGDKTYEQKGFICLENYHLKVNNEYPDADKYCVNKKNVALLLNQEQQEADQNIEWNGKLTSCEDLSNNGYQCYEEYTKQATNGYQYKFYSLGPKMKDAASRKIDNYDGTYYIFDLGSVNANNDYHENYAVSKDNVIELLKSFFNDEDIENNYTLEEVYHLGKLNDKYYFADRNGGGIDLNLDNFIEKPGEWYGKNAILAVNNITINNDGWGITADHKIINSNDGLNIKSNAEFFANLHDDAKTHGAYAWSRKVYIPVIYKIKSKKQICYYDQSTQKYYGNDGNEITSANNTYGITDDEHIRQTFVNQCLCVNYEKKNDSVYNELKNSVFTDTTNEYYNKMCNNKTPEVTPNVCTPSINDKDCNNNGTSFSIGDDTACVFNTKNVNTTVSDSNDSDSKEYTHKYNEYCSLTCAETIDFKLPGAVNSVIAGRYWTWEPQQITLKGTRTCEATVSINKFYSDLGINSNGKLDDNYDSINSISNKYANNKVKTSTDSNRGLVRQLEDLKNAYNAYGQIKQQGYGDTVESHHETCGQAPNTYSCNYTYCHKYEYTVDITGETFVSYNGDCRNSDHDPTKDWKTNQYTLEAAKTAVKNKYELIKKNVDRKINNVNNCSNDLINLSGSLKYNFSPTVTFSYNDENYNNAFINKNFIMEEQESTSPDKGTVKTEDGIIEYYDNIDNNSKQNHSYTTKGDDSSNRITWTKTLIYKNPVEFFVNYSESNLGILQWNKSKISSNSYSMGNIFPVSLKETSGTKTYTLAFSYLGVDKNGERSNKFGRLVKTIDNKTKASKSLDYYCTYDVKNDVTNPTKANFYYRNISLNNFDPNQRLKNNKLGKNWSNEKGQATISEINNSGEEIYEKPEYSYTLTPENMQKIKSLNKALEINGETNESTLSNSDKGYSNFDMYLASSNLPNENQDNETVSDYNVKYWKSNFLDLLSKDGNGYATENVRKSTWNKIWKCNDNEENCGPAWK